MVTGMVDDKNKIDGVCNPCWVTCKLGWKNGHLPK